jgi:hypothetical protein
LREAAGARDVVALLTQSSAPRAIIYLQASEGGRAIVKRLLTSTILAGVLIGSMLVTSAAMGLPLPTPADGQKVGIVASSFGQNVYEYPVGSGTWYLDGNCGNWGADSGTGWYTVGRPVVDPHVTVEYLNVGDAHVAYQTIAAETNVLMPYGSTPAESAYRGFHLRLTPPPGAVPSKTQVASDVSPSDPAFPRSWATANSSALYQELNYAPGPVDTTALGAGRVQFTLTVTNNSSGPAGPIRPLGNEVYGPSTADTRLLDTYEVIPDDPAKALLLQAGESTTFTIRGLAATPGGMNRYSNWNIWPEGERPSLFGVVTWAGRPLAGVTVAPAGNYTSATTIATGAYAKTGLVGLLGGNSVTYSKPGYNPRTLSTAISGGSTTTQNVALTITPTLWRTSMSASKTFKRKSGKVKYTLSCIVKGVGRVPVAGVKVNLQRSTNGKTNWKRFNTYTSNASGLVACNFTSKKPSRFYYRWAVAAQAGVTATPVTSKQRIIVK